MPQLDNACNGLEENFHLLFSIDTFLLYKYVFFLQALINVHKLFPHILELFANVVYGIQHYKNIFEPMQNKMR